MPTRKRGVSVAEAEHALIVERIPRQKIAQTLAGEGTSTFSLEGWSATYGPEWKVASHTFTLLDGESALLTVVLERG
jgi:hypothetical protein